MKFLNKFSALGRGDIKNYSECVSDCPLFITNNWKLFPSTLIRLCSTISIELDAPKISSAKSFKSIPGPIRLPVIGTLLPYKTGVRKVSDYHLDVCKLYHKYGPIVRENFGDQTIIHLFDPNDIQAVYDADGKTPFIPPLQETTRLYRESKNMSPGLGNVNGPEWYRLRHAVQQMMLRPREVSHYLPLQDKVAQTVVSKLPHYMSDDGYIHKLEDFIGKWILESAGTVCFETSLGSFSGGEKERLAEQLLKANRFIFQLTADLKFSLRLYRFIKTPKYKTLLIKEDFFYGISTEFINNTIKSINELVESGELKDGQYNFLAYLMSRKELSNKDIVTITLSLFTDGLSTTVPTMLGNLHCLALNPEVQEKVYQEVTTHIKTDEITPQMLNKMSYLKAFVKEVFRVYPIGETVQRLLQKDMVLSGYKVPAGTYVDLNSYVWLCDDAIFPNAKTIYPERWLRDGGKVTGSGPVIHPYILNPFSIGTRMCAGRRFAEQDLYVGLSRLLQKFRIEASDLTPPRQIWKTLLTPKLPLPIKFIPRN